MATAWTVSIDFDRDGTYTDITAYVISLEVIQGMTEPFQVAADESTAFIVLNNDDRRFSPEYASGTYYGNLLPFRPVRITYNDGVTTRTIYEGWTETWSADTTPQFTKRATVQCSGVKQFLDRAEATIPMFVDSTGDAAIAALTEQVVIPAASGEGWMLGVAGFSELDDTTILYDRTTAFDLETGAHTFAYIGDAFRRDTDDYNQTKVPGATTAYNAMYQITEAEAGRLFFTRAGKIEWWNRTHLQNKPTVNYTLNDTAQRVTYRYGSPLYNTVNLRINERTVVNDATLHTLTKPLTVRAGDSKTIRISYKYNDEPVGASDVAVTTFTATAGTYDASFEATRATVIITNDSAGDATVSALTIKGTAYTQSDALTATAEDLTAIGSYGRRVMEADIKLVDDYDYALTLAQWELFRRKDPQAFLTVSTNKDVNNSVAYSYGDVVRVVDTQTSHDGNHIIIGESFRADQGLLHTEHTMVLEPTDIYTVWVLGETGYTELGDTTHLGF